ncbi:hypothetical protein LXL04_028862 [Taraxacum kok-saghyz]
MPIRHLRTNLTHVPNPFATREPGQPSVQRWGMTTTSHTDPDASLHYNKIKLLQHTQSVALGLKSVGFDFTDAFEMELWHRHKRAINGGRSDFTDSSEGEWRKQSSDQRPGIKRAQQGFSEVIQVSPVPLRIFNEWGITTATPPDPS